MAAKGTNLYARQCGCMYLYYTALLLAACIHSSLPSVQAACTAAVYTACPTAAAAAAALTGSSPLIAISNAQYTNTVCTTAPKQAIALVTSWGASPCHYLGTSMPQGKVLGPI